MRHSEERRPELVSAMLEPDLYPRSPPSVELRETHISWVFLVGDRAYKVKKPLTLPFLDYGTPERRHEMCLEEVRLNRRLAPRIYLGVVGIAGDQGRYHLTSEDDPAAIEYAVEMRRVEEERSLAALLGRGQLAAEQIESVARRLARFHAEAAVSPARFRSAGPLIESLEENLATLGEAGAETVGGSRIGAAGHFTWAFVGARREELEGRARAGLVREGHGDLRAEHAIVPERGEVYVYDCVEFDPALRHIDVAADIAFLVMDLTRLGGEKLGLGLLAPYRREGGDPGDDALLAFFASYRAWVRAKVACLRARELPAGSEERPRRENEARELFRLGHRFAWRARGPLALIVCGVTGTGKTTLARRLATESGWAHISSDLTRKRLAGLAPAERGRAEHYTPEFTARTYREIGAAARQELERGVGVIVDATFHRSEERAAFDAGLGIPPAPIVFVECQAPLQLLRARVGAREPEPDRVSDADESILDRQLAELDPLEEIPPARRLGLLTEATPEELVAEVEAFLDRRTMAAE